jgi:hypothetical protein
MIGINPNKNQRLEGPVKAILTKTIPTKILMKRSTVPTFLTNFIFISFERFLFFFWLKLSQNDFHRAKSGEGRLKQIQAYKCGEIIPI